VIILSIIFQFFKLYNRYGQMVAAMQLSDLLLLIGFYLNKHLKQLKWQTRQKLAEKISALQKMLKCDLWFQIVRPAMKYNIQIWPVITIRCKLLTKDDCINCLCLYDRRSRNFIGLYLLHFAWQIERILRNIRDPLNTGGWETLT